MKHLIVVTKTDQANGFRLAGIHAIGVDNSESAENLINSWLVNKEEILLALDDHIFSNLDQDLINRIYQSNELLLVTIPDGPVSAAEEQRKRQIFEMIRHATGAQINFKGEKNAAT